MDKINHVRIKELGIKPERVRQLINEIELQEINIQDLRGGIRL